MSRTNRRISMFTLVFSVLLIASPASAGVAGIEPNTDPMGALLLAALGLFAGLAVAVWRTRPGVGDEHVDQ